MAEMKSAPYDQSPNTPYENAAIGNNAYPGTNAYENNAFANNAYGNNAYGNAGYPTGPPAPTGGGGAPPAYTHNTGPVVHTVAVGVPITTTIHRQGAPPMPEKYIVHNIMILLFCCLLFGIIGVIKGSQVDSLYIQGHYDAAQAASLSARRWYLWGLWFGIIEYVVVSVIFMAIIFSV